MNIQQLKSLIEQGESETLEFKTSTAQLKPACETLCGFLNAQGGTVLIGVGSKGQIIGQHVTDSTHQEIANELRKFEPAARIKIHYVDIGNKQVIIMRALPGKHAPYIYDGRPFERTLNSKGRMSQHQYEQLMIQRGQMNHAWEEFPTDGNDIDSLDHEEVLRTITKGIQVNRISPTAIQDSVIDVLERFELIKKGKLKNAAVALFAKKLFPKHAQCELKMGRFKGTTNLGDFIDNQQVHGNIFKLLTEADHFLMRHLPIASIFKSDQLTRIDKPILPVLAVREALVNAFCHKDYSDPTSATTLSIFDDRLEIWNCGTLPPNLTLSDLTKKHKSYPRNKLIASVLFSRELFEKWGTGTIKMIDLCREHGIPLPEFEEYSGGLAVTFRFKEPIGTIPLKKPVPDKPLTARQEAVMAIIRQHGSVAIRQIMAELTNPPTQRTIQIDLEYLAKQGLVTKIGSARNTLWKLK